MEVARAFLALLFRLAQSAVSRGQDPNVRLRLTPAKCPGYFDMRDIEDARAFRAELALAERKGAIAIEALPRVERPRDVGSIVVADLGLLALHLDLPLRRSQVDEAALRLQPCLVDFPVLGQLLDRWRAGKKVRGEGPNDQAVDDVMDAVAVVQRRLGKTDEAMLRRVSTDLFKDSKRIEDLAKWLDMLIAQNLAPSGLSSREIFSALGLHKAPVPFLIAGNVSAIGRRGPVPLLEPYMGLAAGSVERFEFSVAPDFVLSVENLQTFHEFASVAEASSNGVIVYSGGMPSPAWHQMYGALLLALPRSSSVLHFGDIDIGGFRISRAIWQSARKFGHGLQPWLMDPSDLVRRGYTLAAATAAQARHMSMLCHAIGWTTIADNLQRCPGTIEQETVHPVLPDVHRP